MREVNYKTHWSYLGAGVKRKAPLVDFVLDILYLMNTSGVIPPYHVLKEVIENGGNSGGMGPGTSWRPFKFKETEYDELVEALLKLDITEAKKIHPYIMFDQVIVDETLHRCAKYQEWMRSVSAKYSRRT